jgi:peptidyl-prolyl cis-trans isomerase A (cyclophilin A)
MSKYPALLLLALLAGCSKSPEPESATPRDEHSPATYRVSVETSKGGFILEVNREWAPLGADRFYTLIKRGFFNGARFFRVLPEFMVQFGLNGDPVVNRKWSGTEFPDDPVTQSNKPGYISFATRGPRTRTTQVFINYADNAFLDAQGFAPFGKVVSGMDVVKSIHSGYRDTPDQTQIETQGNDYIEQNFPKLDFIKSATISGQ